MAMALLMLTGMPAVAQTLSVDPAAGETAVTTFVEYYEDSSESLTIEEVTAANFDVNFIPHDRDILHFGTSRCNFFAVGDVL